MNVAETLLEANHGFAVDGEAEMTGLDDAGMHRANRDLMKAFALRRQELIRRRSGMRLDPGSEWVLHAPAAMIEPGSSVRKVGRFRPPEVLDCAFEADRGRMHLSDRRELAALAFDRHDDNLGVLQQRHVHLVGVTPESGQRHAACRELSGEHAPRLRAHDDARRGLVPFDPLTWNSVDQHRPILEALRRSGTT